MVERYVGNQAGIGFHGIDGIETAAHAHLQDDVIDVMRRKDDQRGERTVFEIGQRHAVAGTFYTLESRDDIVIGRGNAVHADSLVEIYDVWRRVRAHTLALAQQDRLEHRHGRPLAIGSSNVEHMSCGRQCEAAEHGGDAIEAEFDIVWRKRLEASQPLGQRRPGRQHGSSLLAGNRRRTILELGEQFGDLVTHLAPVGDHVDRAVIEQELAALKALGQGLSHGLFNNAGTSETD